MTGLDLHKPPPAVDQFELIRFGVIAKAERSTEPASLESHSIIWPPFTSMVSPTT
jgi:hypothetical protein